MLLNWYSLLFDKTNPMNLCNNKLIDFLSVFKECQVYLIAIFNNFGRKFLVFILLFLVVCFGFLFYDNATAYSKVEFDLLKLPDIHVGDLIFRHGDVADSLFIANLSKFKYSHVGVVVDVFPDILIVHATTSRYDKDENGVILSKLDDFLSHAIDFGIARIDFLDKNNIKLFVSGIKSRVGESFVLDKKDNPNLYCTTLIEQELTKVISFMPKYQMIQLFLFEGEYLFPKALWEYDGINPIYENKF